MNLLKFFLAREAPKPPERKTPPQPTSTEWPFDGLEIVRDETGQPLGSFRILDTRVSE